MAEVVDNLADERKKAEFDVGSMKIVWAGSPQAFDIADRMAKLVANDPVNQSLLLAYLFIYYCLFIVYCLMCIDRRYIFGIDSIISTFSKRLYYDGS